MISTTHANLTGSGSLPDPTSIQEKESSIVAVTNIFKRIINSTVCRFLGVTTLLITFRATIINVGKSLPRIATITALAVGALTLFLNREKLIYELTLAYPVIRSKLDSKFQWYHEIVPRKEGRGAVYLGTIPLKNLGHHETLKEFAVLSLLSDFEFYDSTPWSDPVTPEDWKKLGTPHKHIPAKDFHPLPLDTLREAVLWIDKQASQGKDVYVHCKAGRSRSGAAVIGYQVYRKNEEDELSEDAKDDTLQAYQQVKDIRSRIILNNSNLDVVERFHRELRAN